MTRLAERALAVAMAAATATGRLVEWRRCLKVGHTPARDADTGALRCVFCRCSCS